jgi:hypothetical protein
MCVRSLFISSIAVLVLATTNVAAVDKTAAQKKTRPKLQQTISGTTAVIVHITGLATFADSTAGGTPTPKVLYLMDAHLACGGMKPHTPIVLAHKS